MRGLLSPTSTRDVTAALTAVPVPPHSTSVQKGVGLHRAQMLFRAGKLVYTAVADLALLPANPGTDCCCCIPVCSTKTLCTSLYYHHLTQSLLPSSATTLPPLLPLSTSSSLALSVNLYLHLTQHHCRDASTAKPPRSLSGSHCEGRNQSTA